MRPFTSSALAVGAWPMPTLPESCDDPELVTVVPLSLSRELPSPEAAVNFASVLIVPLPVTPEPTVGSHEPCGPPPGAATHASDWPAPVPGITKPATAPALGGIGSRHVL